MAYRLKKAKELRQMSTEQLRKRLQEIGATQLILRWQKESAHAINPGQWRNIKKEKARILTILRERELGIRGQK